MPRFEQQVPLQPSVVRQRGPLASDMLNRADGTIKRREGAHPVAGGARRKEGCATWGAEMCAKGPPAAPGLFFWPRGHRIA